MAKKDLKDIPTLGKDDEDEDEEDEEESEEDDEEESKEEPKQEEGKLQIVTTEQLTQFKLDNLSLQIQETNSKTTELIGYVKALVEVLKKRK